MEKDGKNLMPGEPRDGSLLTVLISGFVAGVTATIAIFGIFKKE